MIINKKKQIIIAEPYTEVSGSGCTEYATCKTSISKQEATQSSSSHYMTIEYEANETYNNDANIPKIYQDGKKTIINLFGMGEIEAFIGSIKLVPLEELERGLD